MGYKNFYYEQMSQETGKNIKFAGIPTHMVNKFVALLQNPENSHV